jgi:hypothetical protein
MFTKLSHSIKVAHLQKLALSDFDAISLTQESLARDSLNNPQNLNSNLYVMDKLNEGVGKGVQHANTYFLKDKIPLLGKAVDSISDLRDENQHLLPQIPEGGLYRNNLAGTTIKPEVVDYIAENTRTNIPKNILKISPEQASRYDDLAGWLLASTGLGSAAAIARTKLRPRSRFF